MLIKSALTFARGRFIQLVLIGLSTLKILQYFIYRGSSILSLKAVHLASVHCHKYLFSCSCILERKREIEK